MRYMLWNNSDKKWFKEEYDSITEARESAYRKRCNEIYVCAHNEKAKHNKGWTALGIVMGKRYNKYEAPIYISYGGSKGSTYLMNPDGTLGRKLD